jgi:hypothetical protein
MIAKMIRWFGRTAFWKWIAQHVIAHMTFRVMSYPSFPMEDFFEVLNKMSANKNTIYCFASSDHASLASLLIRRVTRSGVFSHAGVVIPAGARGCKVLHMMGEGPQHEHLLDLLREIDYFALVAVELSKAEHDAVMRKINYIIANKEKFYYDYTQELNNGDNKLYCSEMIYAVLDGYVHDPDFKARNILGRKVFDPDQVVKIGKVVYTNHPKLINITENTI